MPIDFPNSPTTNQTFTVGNRTWQYDGEKWGLLALSTTNNIPISLLDIDGGTPIGAALVDTDLFVVDDGANGTNRSSAISRIYDYITSKFSSLGATGQNVRIGVTAAGEIDTTSGNLTIDSAGGTVTIDDNLTVNGNLVVSGSMNSISSSSSGTYTLQLSDANKILEFTSAVTVSVPGSTVAFPVGTSITIIQQGTGQVTIASAANVDVVTGLQATLSTGTAVVTLTTGTTSNILVGQSLVKTSGTGAFGASAKVLSIQSSTQFTATINHATAGAITFKTTDIVLRSSTGPKTRTQYSVATLIKRSDTEWWVMGDTTP